MPINKILHVKFNVFNFTCISCSIYIKLNIFLVQYMNTKYIQFYMYWTRNTFNFTYIEQEIHSIFCSCIEQVIHSIFCSFFNSKYIQFFVHLLNKKYIQFYMQFIYTYNSCESPEEMHDYHQMAGMYEAIGTAVCSCVCPQMAGRCQLVGLSSSSCISRQFWRRHLTTCEANLIDQAPRVGPIATPIPTVSSTYLTTWVSLILRVRVLLRVWDQVMRVFISV
jgi:hypothetical protein